MTIRLRLSLLGAAVALGAAITLVAHTCADPENASSTAVTWLSHRDKLYAAARVGDVLFVVGYPGILMRSSDNGEHFTRVPVPTHDALFSIAFNASGKGAVVGRSGLVLVTEDAGAHWVARKVVVADESPHLFGVSVLPDGVIVAVGEFGAIARSEDRGQHWTRSPYSTERPVPLASAGPVGALAHRSAEEENEGAVEEARLLGVQFADNTRGYVVGEFGLVLASEDAGRTFKRQNSATDKLLFAVHAVSADHVIAAGSDGTVVETRDAGMRWEAQATDSAVHLFGVWASPERALVVGADGALFVREGEGAFVRTATGVHTWLEGASFDSHGHGVLLGGRGYVLYSSDGGKTQRRILGE